MPQVVAVGSVVLRKIQTDSSTSVTLTGSYSYVLVDWATLTVDCSSISGGSTV